MKEVRYNRKIILRDEEKESVEKEGRQDDQDDEDTEVNDEEQNINENIAVAEVDIGLGWGLLNQLNSGQSNQDTKKLKNLFER